MTCAFAFIAFLSKSHAVSPPLAPETALPGGNTADGQLALASLTTGLYNSAFGIYTLLSLTDGSLCTGVGAGALLSNNALENTATGAGALFSHVDGAGNTANGAFALFSDTSGLENTAIGDRALLLHTAGGFNTAVGTAAMLNDDTGSNNVAIGVQALGNNISGSSNIALGNGAGVGVTTATNVICIGAGGDNVDSSCYIGGIWNRSVDPGSAMSTFVDGSGKLGTVVSSRRFKHDIKPMDTASEAILALKPVTFHYNSDSKGTPQFGLVAEEVAVVDPDLIVRDKNGEILTVRYEAVNAMLLNEFLKEHHKVKEQEARIAQLEKDVRNLVAHVRQQDSQTQRMSIEIETNKPARSIVINEP